MLPSERRKLIVALSQHGETLSARELAQTLKVTVQTIRTDLRALSNSGILERTHGGAVAPSGVRHIEYGERRNLNRAAKSKIGRAAANLIPNDASVFLNIGTTTENVARCLDKHRNLMVVTNNLNVASILTGHPSCQVFVTGGQLRAQDGGMVGDLAAQAVERFRVDIAVIGASALDSNGDLLDFDPAEVRVSQTILSQARTSILVVDRSKFQRHAPLRIAKMTDLDHVVTDHLRENLFNSLSDVGTKVHFV